MRTITGRKRDEVLMARLCGEASTLVFETPLPQLSNRRAAGAGELAGYEMAQFDVPRAYLPGQRGPIAYEEPMLS